MERKTPLKSVPANRSPSELIAKDMKRLSINPVFIAVQLSPLSVERKTPSSSVPANMSPSEFIAREKTKVLVSKAFTFVQLSQLSVERKMPSSKVPANISPAEHVSKDTPPTIIVIGRTDTVTPLEGSELFHNKMLEFGNESELHIYDGVGHLFTPATEPDDGWPNPDKQTSLKAQAEIDKFLKKHEYIN